MSFHVIPAIDILNGNCVRLEQGDFAKATVYDQDPVAPARVFATAGARRLHVVDLDGARAGKPVNHELVKALAAAARAINPAIEIQLGGGLRTPDAIAAAFATGVSRVILGSAAIANPYFLKMACGQAPGKVMLGLDAISGNLAVDGWTKETTQSLLDFAGKGDEYGVAGIIYTDIDRDGLLKGPNLATTFELAGRLSCPVYASGGIGSLADVALLEEGAKLAGAIVGRAIYSGNISLEELESAGYL